MNILTMRICNVIYIYNPDYAEKCAYTFNLLCCILSPTNPNRKSFNHMKHSVPTATKVLPFFLCVKVWSSSPLVSSPFIFIKYFSSHLLKIHNQQQQHPYTIVTTEDIFKHIYTYGFITSWAKNEFGGKFTDYIKAI